MSLASHRLSPRVDLSTQACDVCRRRKVKCNLSVVSSSSPARCGRCERLNIPCTFLLPSKARGPKKRLRANVQSAGDDGNGLHERRELGFVSPSLGSPAHRYSTDDLCDRGLFRIIMDDYLDYLYPLIPIVHRPSFRRCLEEDSDNEDMEFSGLIISLAAVVVATMPGKFESYRAHSPPLRFQSRREMVTYCHDRITRLKTSTYFDEINFRKFATSYLSCVAFLQMGDHNRSRICDVEAMQFARLLYLHRISEYEGLNCIETQLRKRGFWLVFYGFVHSSMQNMFGERLSYLDPVVLRSINPDDLMPLEVDDEMIFENEVIMPTTPTPCVMTGFNLHSRVFWAGIRNPCPSESAEEPCPCVRAQDINLEVPYLRERIRKLKFLLDDIPPLLRPWVPIDETIDESAPGTQTDMVRSDFATIRANLHVTHLWLQSLLIDQLEAAQSRQEAILSTSPAAHLTPNQRALWSEREEICRQLFFVLHSIPQVNLEANGLHLAYKVRDIAASLLACPFNAPDPEAKRAAEYVQYATNVLSRLDRSENVNTMHLQTWVDTDRIGRQSH